MPDIEQTTHELELVMNDANPWKECPPVSCDVSYSLLCDVLHLLKEQAEKPKKQAEPPKGQKAKYKSCSNCSHSKFQAIRGTSCFGYRCKKLGIWGKYGFRCSDWSKREEKDA